MKEFNGKNFYNEFELKKIVGDENLSLLKEKLVKYIFIKGNIRYKLLHQNINIVSKRKNVYCEIIHKGFFSHKRFVESYNITKHIEGLFAFWNKRYVNTSSFNKEDFNDFGMVSNPYIYNELVLYPIIGASKIGNFCPITRDTLIKPLSFSELIDSIEKNNTPIFISQDEESKIRIKLNKLRRQEQSRFLNVILDNKFLNQTDYYEALENELKNKGMKGFKRETNIITWYYSENDILKKGLNLGLDISLSNHQKLKEKINIFEPVNDKKNEDSLKEKSIPYSKPQNKRLLRNQKIIIYALIELLKIESKSLTNVSKIADGIFSFYTDNKDFEFLDNIPKVKTVSNTHSNIKKEIENLVIEAFNETQDKFSQR